MTKPTKWLWPREDWSAWASTQSDQCLRCPHEESLGPYLPAEQTAKTLIRLGGCPGWSESSLGAQPLCWFCHEWLICFSTGVNTNFPTCAVNGADQLPYMQKWHSTKLIESCISSVDRQYNSTIYHYCSVQSRIPQSTATVLNTDRRQHR